MKERFYLGKIHSIFVGIITIILTYNLHVQAQSYSYIGQYRSDSLIFLQDVRDITSDALGNVYVLESNYNRVSVLTFNGNTYKVNQRFAIPNLQFPDPSSNYYTQIAFLEPNQLVVTEPYKKGIYVFSISGQNLSLKSRYNPPSSTNFSVQYDYGLTVDKLGKIYVADNYNYKINILTTLGTNMGIYSIIPSSIAGVNQYFNVRGLVADNQNRIIVSTGYNLLSITSSGITFGLQTTLGVNNLSLNGLNLSEIDSQGRLYFSSNYNSINNLLISVVTGSGNNFGLYSSFGVAGTTTGQLSSNIVGITSSSNGGIAHVMSNYPEILSAFTLNRTTNTYQFKSDNKPSANMLMRPSSIKALDTSKIYVNDFNNKIHVLSITGSSFQKLVTNHLKDNQNNRPISPFGIGFSKDTTIAYVSDNNSNLIFTLSVSSNFTPINKVGGTGTIPGMFDLPYGLATTKDLVFVCDGNNHRIQVFSISGTNLVFKSSFGSIGSTPGNFNMPVGITVSDDNKVYVTEIGNNRIQVLTIQGTNLGFYAMFGKTEINSFQFPVGIDLDGANKIYVADFLANKIHIITSSGTNFGMFSSIGETGFGNGQLFRPIALSISSNGKIFVSDYGNNRLQVFGGATPKNRAITSIEKNLLNGATPYLFPNPSSGTFTIRSLPTEDTISDLKIYDMSGKLKVEEKIAVLEGNLKVEAPNLSDGIYVVMITIGNEKFLFTILITR